MRRQPPYFERIRLRAERRWEQLEADRELAAPWRLLFNQVQSPRHVLSELLQNADDAGATEVSVRTENGAFVFEHDGHDFTEEEFESLCRFGFSNKRRLLTIGFRGIGFRSVFSLGPAVEVLTPSLACRFEKQRFTQPHWIGAAENTETTLIRVRFESPEKERILRSQIEQWSKSPLPLLFFQSIRRLRLPGQEVSLKWIGPGPCTNSKRARLSGRECIVFRSALEDFPPECLDEIRLERGEDITLPPCEVIIVLGGVEDPRLYVVLPTDVTLPLPFSCQAPFVQDPARTGIKDPAMSPTNTWLLKRIGALAAEKLMEWLERRDMSLAERARAYALVPEYFAGPGSTTSSAATKLVLDSFRERLGDAGILLCTDGSLDNRDSTARLPDEVLDVWPPETARGFFCPGKLKVLAREVSSEIRNRLAKWDLLDEAVHDQILEALQDQSKAPPRPVRLEALASLWSFAEQKTRGRYRWADWWQTAAIVPVAGRDHLGRARDVLPSRGKPVQCSTEDWQFLLDRAEVLDPEWSEMIARIETDRKGTKKRIGEAIGRAFSDEDIAGLLNGFRNTMLGEAVQVDRVFSQVAQRVFGGDEVELKEGIRLVHIGARLDVKVSGSAPIYYLCQDGLWRSREEDLVCRSELDLEGLTPTEWLNTHLISDLYERDLEAAFIPKWRAWLTEPDKGGLTKFPLPAKKETTSWRLNSQLFRSRGVEPPAPRLSRKGFVLGDWDWEEVFWCHWRQLEQEGVVDVWREIAWGVVSSWSEAWKQRLVMEVKQEGYSRIYQIDNGNIPAAWIHTLKGLPCLPDQFGRMHPPAELFVRTADTLPLIEVEPFLHDRWDIAEHREALLALGVRTEPTDASVLIDRLRALAQAEDPPLGPLRDLYRAIERVVARLPADSSSDLVQAFEEHALIRTEAGWTRRQFCFRENPDEIPGVAVIHREFRDVLGLWERLKIRQQPALDDALEWLESISAEDTLQGHEMQGVRKLLSAYPQQVWRRTGRWLSLQGRLVSTTEFRWGCIDSKLAAGLFASVKSETADFSMVDRSRWSEFDGATLPRLESCIERRPLGVVSSPMPSTGAEEAWLRTLGHVLRRLRYSDGSGATHVQADRAAAERLSKTRWKTVQALRVQVFLNDTPAGLESEAPVIWHGEALYVCGSAASQFKPLVQEISRHFSTQEAREVVQDCAARDPKWIEDYAKNNLRLEEADDAVVLPPGPSAGAEPCILPPEKPDESASEQESANGQIDSGESPRPPAAPEQPTQPPRSPVSKELERLTQFFRKHGFVWDPDAECFRHADGSIIRKSDGIFRWELRHGDTYYPIWVATSSLTSSKGVELPAEVWMAAENCDAILLEPDGNDFVALRFETLRQAAQEGRVDIFPAVYRIRSRKSE